MPRAFFPFIQVFQAILFMLWLLWSQTSNGLMQLLGIAHPTYLSLSMKGAWPLVGSCPWWCKAVLLILVMCAESWKTTAKLAHSQCPWPCQSHIYAGTSKGRFWMPFVAVSTKYGKKPLNYEQQCALLSCVYSGKCTGPFHVVEWPAFEMEYVRSFAVLGCLGILVMSNFVI